MVAHSPACTDPECPIPSGLCHCGCGSPPLLARRTEHAKRRVAGAPHLFRRGHNPTFTTRSRTRPRPYDVDETGCWLWQLALDRHGYGQWKVDGKNRLAHRAMYERTVGPIPDGLTLDHLCNVRACVNPAHLEPVPFAENMRRRDQVRSRSGSEPPPSPPRLAGKGGGTLSGATS